jgi:hypothetical protein
VRPRPAVQAWLPFALWSVVASVILLLLQPGFSYCADLHARLCANALLADVASGLDFDGLVAVAALLAVGWSVIAVARIFGRKTGVAIAAWTVAAAVFFVFGYGGRVQMCLGPIGVTEASCRVALGLPPETDVDRFLAGPGPFVLLLAAGWLAIVLVARRSRNRSVYGRDVGKD